MRPSVGIQLHWKSYLSDLRSLLQRLRQSEELTDVVLTNGTTSMRCHRVILSAACQTFHDLLKEHSGDVVICLGGVESAELRSLVDYMYSGEVEVARGRLAEFLALAAQWGVRGLEESPPDDAHTQRPSSDSETSSDEDEDSQTTSGINKPSSSTPTSASKTKSHKATKKSARDATGVLPKMFACPHCPRVFIKGYFFEAHMKNQHNDDTAPEEHRLRVTAGSSRVVQMASGLVSIDLPPLTKKKRKKQQSDAEETPKKKKKAAVVGKPRKKRRGRTAEDRAAEAAAVVAAADAAVKAALERAAQASREAGPSESPSARGPRASEVMAAPSKRARPTSASSSSESDSDGDPPVEVLKAGARPAAAESTPAATSSPVASIPLPPLPSEPPPSPQSAPPPPPPVPPPAPPPPAATVMRAVSLPPRPRDSRSLPPPTSRPSWSAGVSAGSGGSNSPRPSRIVFDEDGQPCAPTPAPPEPQDVKPVIVSIEGGEQGNRTRIVFDQDGRSRPPPPPIGIATHVRRDSSSSDRARDGHRRDGDGSSDRNEDRNRDKERDREREREKERDKERDRERERSKERDRERERIREREREKDRERERDQLPKNGKDQDRRSGERGRGRGGPRGGGPGGAPKPVTGRTPFIVDRQGCHDRHGPVMHEPWPARGDMGPMAPHHWQGSPPMERGRWGRGRGDRGHGWGPRGRGQRQRGRM
ncbi:Broad-complex core protein isoforms 1/2/3/4/5 [Amphibalanus amphitrite]|nr:Broad-complex core protein isoforms 1/2/3/4/5 [Amphibalanus amphitrite]KAF0307500.1 Broad-complex core protein isoforms 1/2/3/4/5 [Amphibalanus amphitrite]